MNDFFASFLQEIAVGDRRKKSQTPFAPTWTTIQIEGNLAMARNAKAREKQKRINKAHRKQRKEDENKLQVQDAMKWLIDEKMFAGLSLHGNTSWQCSGLVCLTLLWVWSTTPQLTQAFVDARSKATKLGVPITITTYQGLMKALVSATPKLMPVLQKRMHTLMDRIGGKHMRVGCWVAIAVDGSKETAPRTVSNEAAFRPKNYGQGKNAKNRKRKRSPIKKPSSKKTPVVKAESSKSSKPVPLPPPQVWLTMMWHIGLGIPWCWKLGPSSDSERTHVLDMLKTGDFLDDTLFVGDAGFVGYDFWRAIMNRQHHFLVRVGANVNLLTELYGCQRDAKDIVYCWPQTAMKSSHPPLRLRLVKCTIGKNENVWLLTSVLDRKELPNKQMKRLYEQRWGIELEFRALKQTFERRKLRCRNHARVLTEIEWSIFGMAAVELMAFKEQVKDADCQTEKLSFSQSLTAIRHSLNNLTDCPEFLPTLRDALRSCLIDDYQRKKMKAGRYHPKRKKPPSCGQPNIDIATHEHRRRLRAMSLQNAA